MTSYYLKCRKSTEIKNPKFVKTKNGRIMLLSKWTARNSKKSKSIKHARRFLSNLTGIKVPILSYLPIINTFNKIK